MTEKEQKIKILIADDSEMNRAILAEMLGEGYEILEAEDGEEALDCLTRHGTTISLVLLDIVMPKMDGFGVLTEMNKKHLIEEIPVIMISAEGGAEAIRRAYNLGISDYISRPFDMEVVRKRVTNTLMLYAKQKQLLEMVAEQVYEKQKSNTLMVNILSHIVEFRNGESGLHVIHVHMITRLLLEYIRLKTDRYDLTDGDIQLISMASALHDIGKIAIPDEILNKPGRLTQEEFEIMKTHALTGASMLADLPVAQDEPLVRYSYEICRWHHERYDGKGYPDGLSGEQIPISAQVVGLADVYDALTSERVYKKAFSHEKALEMILGGECGVFSPFLMECLRELSGTIKEDLEKGPADYSGEGGVSIRKAEAMFRERQNRQASPVPRQRSREEAGDGRLGGEDLRRLAESLELVYDRVRLVDVSSSAQYRIGREGELTAEPYDCYRIWDRKGRCENCISARAYAGRSRASKWERSGGGLYQVDAMYIETEDGPFVLEMIRKLSEEEQSELLRIGRGGSV